MRNKFNIFVAEIDHQDL
ncbi:MAG: hypothetical protein QF879_13660, partial [Candidatus Latescibacteria bacterium]|nr:hypothetical protein [Candidatus Latescibacterota bacterium]